MTSLLPVKITSFFGKRIVENNEIDEESLDEEMSPTMKSVGSIIR